MRFPAWTLLQCFTVLSVAASGLAAGPAVAIADDGNRAAEVSAAYRLYFNGLEVGNYTFSSTTNGKTYQAQSQAKISALFGAFSWKGSIASRGAVNNDSPRPEAYGMVYKTRSKQGSVTLGFEGSKVASVQLVPNKPPSPEAVPVESKHLAGVLDPMSAILAISQSDGANPCDRRIPVFDGKVRFQLAMSYKKEQRVADEHPTGLPQSLIVCRVKYQPIAGHKPKDFVDPWVSYDNIEIALRHVPSAGLYVPYRITIPTTIGAAEMAVERIDIRPEGQAQIALRQ